MNGLKNTNNLNMISSSVRSAFNKQLDSIKFQLTVNKVVTIVQLKPEVYLTYCDEIALI